MNIPDSFTFIQCGSCGVGFYIPAVLYDEFFNVKGRSWYCPNGHRRSFTETKADELKREIEALERINRRLVSGNVELRRDLACMTKQACELREAVVNKKRDKCPICEKYVTHLKRHMQIKHPDEHKGNKPPAPEAGSQ
jgi:hypothetical protein